MTIRLPDLPGSSCVHFIACGRLDSEEKDAVKWIKKNTIRKIAKTKTHGKVAFVRAMIGHVGFAGHCHLDVATSDYFLGDLPDQTATWTEIQAHFVPLIGKRMTVEAEGLYTIDETDLPSIIKTTRLFDVVQEGVTLKMTGGRLSVTGTPIYSISWNIGPNKVDVPATVLLEARIQIELDESYLIKMFDLLRYGYESFIESGVPRGKK